MSAAAEEAKARIARRLRSQSAACGRRGSRLYEHLLRCAAEDLEAGGPTWTVLCGHEDDPGTSALALRFMGVVNRLALDGREPELAACYRDAGRDPTEVWREFRATLERNADVLRQLVDRPVQTNEVGRCAALLAGFLTVAVEAGLPLRLLEVGASAGLNLRWDRYRYLAEGYSWGPAESPVAIEFELNGKRFPDVAAVQVVQRRGCDAAPLDPSSAEGRLTLLSYIWPDQVARIERMRAALALAEQEEAVRVEREGAAPWIARRLLNVRPGIASVVYHSFVAQYMGKEERAAFISHLRKAGERASADAPLAWLRMELAGDLANVRLTIWPGGEERCLARADVHGSPVYV